MYHDSQNDYSHIVYQKQYWLNASFLEYEDVLRLVINVEDKYPKLDVSRNWGSPDLTFDLLDGREKRVLIEKGIAAIAGERLEKLFGPDEAGPLVSRIIAGFTLEKQHDGRQFGELTEDAEEALSELEDRMADLHSDLQDDYITMIPASDYVGNLLTDEELDDLRKADTDAKIRDLAEKIRSLPDVFICENLFAALLCRRDQLLK